VNVYLESSAALRDVLEGDGAREIIVATSRLTLAEVGRVLARLRVTHPKAAGSIASREAAFVSDSELWAIQPIDEDILQRCGRPFPVEPVRVLDAIHLASIETLSGALGRLTVLSTDERIRKNAEQLGFGVLP
jgi:predicted nucleic acid-binding protein